MITDKLTLDFGEIGMKDLPRVGGKNASLGEMFNALRREGVGVLDGFATTVAAYRLFLQSNGLQQRLESILDGVLLAGEFLKIFDGYSIGSNDLTQLVLGIDRDSGTISRLFDERNQAVRQMIANAISAAHIAGKPIGICGQAPSDYPDFAAWLVGCGIDSISLNPDSAISTAFVIAAAERQQKTGMS